MTKYNTIEMMFDLPRRIKLIDKKIAVITACSWEEENAERLYNKLVDIKLLRSRLYNKYTVLANRFNEFNKDIRNAIGAVFAKNLSIHKVAILTNSNEKLLQRKFDKVDKILEYSIKENTNEQVL